MRQMRVLSDEEIRHYAPSVFAESAGGNTSNRFRFFPTHMVLDGLRENGFLPVRASQTKVRDADNKEFARHLLRFRHESYMNVDKVGARIPEMTLVNAHDGTSSYWLLASLLELLCLNGMVGGGRDEFEMRVKHRGDQDMVGDVIDASFQIVEQFPQIIEAAEEMSNVPVTQAQAMAFAEAAHSLRWHKEDEEGNVHAPIEPYQLLQRRRHEDSIDNVYGVLNVTQENLMKGGLQGRSANNRRTRTRAIKNVTEDVRLNRALWVLAESLKEQVAA